jgi:hypothetical protein
MRLFSAMAYCLLALCCVSGTRPAAAAGEQVFGAIKADVDLDIEDGEFEILVDFSLAPGSNGLNLPSEAVSLEVKGGKASFTVSIPAGSFKKESGGQLVFQGTVNRVRMRAFLRTMRSGMYQFEIEGDRVNLKGVANPVTVRLTIGDDSGSSTVTAKIE